MLIAVFALIAAWLVLNAGLLAAVAFAHRAGQRKVARGTVTAPRLAIVPARSLGSAR